MSPAQLIPRQRDAIFCRMLFHLLVFPSTVCRMIPLRSDVPRLRLLVMVQVAISVRILVPKAIRSSWNGKKCNSLLRGRPT